MEKHYLRCGVKMVSTPAPLQSLGYDGSAKTLARTYMYIHTYLHMYSHEDFTSYSNCT